MSSPLSIRHYTHDKICHSHDYAQLVFGLSGRLDFEVEGHGSQVISQTLSVIPHEARHTCGSPSGSRCLVLDVPSEQWLKHQLGAHANAVRRLLDKTATLTLTSHQSQLVNWLANSPIGDPVIAAQGSALLLASLSSETLGAPLTVGLPMAALNAHIDRHAAHPLQVSDLAKLAGLSTARFHVRFLQQTGQTPMEYVRIRRLHLARELLVNTSLAVGEIAARVGYNSQSAFTAALSRHYGCSALALRQQHN
ncbi:AraC family transcriptional regulator [Ectopseudomonas mendocina]|uniref:AraC family transcriptional regulator n=1 Tax=Ectopseudomonas mendocina TaxID=300 RepID=A0ABZ2RJW0_ECTME